jgi:toxin FitB
LVRLAASKPELAAQIETRTAAAFDAFDGRILAVDRAVATHWGKALGENEKHVDDTGLAATARVHGLVVVTRNTRDFVERGVPIINPYKSPPERLP